jgi:hypothetical protein
MAYEGIVKNNLIKASDIEKALDTKVSLTGDQNIEGKKTFTTSPLVPSKSTAAGSSNSTVIATEAQVKAVADSAAEQIAAMSATNTTYTDTALASKVSMTGNVTETISGIKTFATSPVVPSKSTKAGNSPTVIATEAQVYAANVWQ